MTLKNLLATSLFAAGLAACGSDSEPAGYGVNRGNLSKPANAGASQSVPVVPGYVSVETSPLPSSSGATSIVEGPAGLVPDDAIAYIEIQSIDELAAMLGGIAESFDPRAAQMFNVDVMLAGLLMRGGDADEIRRDAPIGIALSLSDTSEPEPTFILPVTNARGFLSSVSSMPGMAAPRNGGNWVGVPMRSAYPVGASTLALDMPGGMIAARVDAERLIATFRPMISMGLVAMRNNMGSQAGGMSPLEVQMAEMTIEWCNRLVDSAKHIDVTLDMESDQMDFAYSLRMREGSPLAEFGSEHANAIAELARYIQPDDTFSIMAGWDDAFYQEHMRPMLELLAELGEENGEFMAQAIEHVDEYCALTGSSVVATGDWGAGQVEFATYFAPEDAEKAIARFVELVDQIPPPPGGELAGPIATEVDGAKVWSWAATFDPATADPKMTQVFGGNSIRLRVAERGGHVLVNLGGDDETFDGRLGTLGRAAQNTAIPGDLATAFERIEGSNPSFAYRVDMLGIMNSVPQLFADELGGGAPEMTEAQLASLGDEPLNFTVYGAIDGPVWRGGFVTDFARLGEFVSAGQ